MTYIQLEVVTFNSCAECGDIGSVLVPESVCNVVKTGDVKQIFSVIDVDRASQKRSEKTRRKIIVLKNNFSCFMVHCQHRDSLRFDAKTDPLPYCLMRMSRYLDASGSRESEMPDDHSQLRWELGEEGERGNGH